MKKAQQTSYGTVPKGTLPSPSSRDRINMSISLIVFAFISVVLFLGVSSATYKTDELMKSFKPFEVKSDDKISDDQSSCLPINSGLKMFPTMLEGLSGFAMESNPLCVVLMTDRGNYSAYKTNHDPYNWEETNTQIVAQYDSLMDTCLSDISTCTFSFNTTGSIDFRDEIFAHDTSPNIESCIESRLLTYEPSLLPLDPSTCSDPVEFAFIYARSLIKSCLLPSYDCTEGGTIQCETGCFDCIDSFLQSVGKS
jgi:hypothetical protein